MPRARSVSFILITILIGILFALVIAEIALRVVGYSDPYFYRTDPELGWALNPNSHGWYTGEGRSYFQVNAAGRHDEDVPTSKPPGTFRIAVLGDSFTEAKQVPVEQNFCSLIQSNLKNCDALHASRVEVLNFGVAGYGTIQELLMMRQRVWQYSPDMVMLVFFVENDVFDNSAPLGANIERPFLVRKNDAWTTDYSFRQLRHYKKTVAHEHSIGSFLRNLIRVAQLFKQARRGLEHLGEHELFSAAPRGLPSLDQPARSPELKNALDATYYALDTMSQEARAHDARFLMVIIGNLYQVDPNPEVRAAKMRQLGITNEFAFEDQLASFAQDHGFEALSLVRPFQKYAVEHHVYLHGFANSKLGIGHWNPEGHALAAELMEKKICQMYAAPGQEPKANPAN